MSSLKPRTRYELIKERASRVGLDYDTWSPGDGVTRHRFGRPYATEIEPDYFGMDKAYTALGAKEAETFLRGCEVALSLPRRAT